MKFLPLFCLHSGEHFPALFSRALSHAATHCDTLQHTIKKDIDIGSGRASSHGLGRIMSSLNPGHTYVCVLQCVAVCCSVLQCVAVCCSVSQCVAVLQYVPHCVAVFRIVLQCVVVCCSVLQSVTMCPAVRCSVLQCVTVCCSVLQCVEVCYSV